jgi:hypothetical protein
MINVSDILQDLKYAFFIWFKIKIKLIINLFKIYLFTEDKRKLLQNQNIFHQSELEELKEDDLNVQF